MNPRAMRRYLQRENAKQPSVLTRLTDEQIPAPRHGRQKPKEMWRSSGFLLQIYDAGSDERRDFVERLSINRTMVDDQGRWSEDISWDELQELKRQCGRGDFDAVEVYPKDRDIVNVANMRHLWVFKGIDLPFVWRAKP